jgi:hypothetical protein
MMMAIDKKVLLHRYDYIKRKGICQALDPR